MEGEGKSLLDDLKRKGPEIDFNVQQEEDRHLEEVKGGNEGSDLSV